MQMRIKDYATLQAAVKNLTEHLATYGVEKEKVFDCKLVACELLGNVLKHGNGEGALYAEIENGFVLIRVTSENGFTLPKEITCSDLLSEHGRGLYLVQTLCEGEIYSGEDGISVRIRIKK